MAVKTADPKPGTKFYMLTVINHEVTVIGRVRHGMNAEDAVNTPVMTSSEVPSHSRNPAFNTTNQRIHGEKIYSSSCVGLVKVNKE